MIVPMKKVTLLALKSEQDSALVALRSLGVMQIEQLRVGASDSAQQLKEEFDSGSRIVGELDKLFKENDGEVPAAGKRCSGAEAIESAGALLDKRDQLSGELNALSQRLKALEVWGEFDRPMLDELREKGIYVHLCAGSERQLREAEELPGVECRVIRQDSARIYFAAVSLEEPEPGTLPEIRLSAEDDPAELRSRIQERGREVDVINGRLKELFASLPAAKKRLRKLHAEWEFTTVHDSLDAHGEVVTLTGFVPEPELETLRAAARTNGWGLLVADPGPDDQVPTLLRESKFAKLISPLFQFLGISPGYHELDVSAAVLVFFTIFYGMIIGDAGYGLLFLAGTLFAMWKFRGRPAAQLPCRMMLVLSIAAIVWGVLTSNYFGTSPLPGLKIFTDPAVKDANVQAFCFILAIAQLSLGRIWQAFRDRNFRNIGKNIGWMLILWGNFFLTLKLIVWPGDFPVYMYWLYGIGLLLVIACDVNWKNMADVFQFPFNIIGSFVDVLSYIRLFAVGMAGYYIAFSFNGMASDIWKSSPWFLVFGVLVAVIGHAMNLGLCILSVLVHGVRLNTLEFSNHVGLSWSGSNFKPFKNNTKSEEN